MSASSPLIELPSGVANLAGPKQLRLIEIFLSALPELLESLFSAIKESDEQLVAHYAHKLKGMSQIVGATQLATIAIKWQDHPNNIDSSEIELLKSIAESTMLEAHSLGQHLG